MADDVKPLTPAEEADLRAGRRGWRTKLERDRLLATLDAARAETATAEARGMRAAVAFMHRSMVMCETPTDIVRAIEAEAVRLEAQAKEAERG